MAQDSSTAIPGSLSVSNDVLADLVGHAALESYGVVGMAAPNVQDGIAKLLPARRLRRGVTVSSDADGLSVDLYVVIEHGTSINTVSENLASSVRFVLENYAQIPVKDIAIHVQGIHVRKD
ncbi:MAG: Asp23/Gls24 family envelope stress response protein [Coriobacteriales bacterium]|jgi:uncharacterized alkaline shock family protein YloU|nr:Asp23/Gls24 family envelope stress response protein [Coriobacteriales bacterium]